MEKRVIRHAARGVDRREHGGGAKSGMAVSVTTVCGACVCVAVAVAVVHFAPTAEAGHAGSTAGCGCGSHLCVRVDGGCERGLAVERAVKAARANQLCGHRASAQEEADWCQVAHGEAQEANPPNPYYSTSSLPSLLTRHSRHLTNPPNPYYSRSPAIASWNRPSLKPKSFTSCGSDALPYSGGAMPY
eukprot:4241111-Prymnesium_polylepis.1